MSDDETWVLLEECGTKFEAELTRGALESAGMKCHADTDGPADEFTATQHLAGRGVGVYVPEERLDEAKALLVEIRAGRDTSADEVPWDAPDPEAESDD